MMSKRHADALYIQCGACNPSGIANSIVEACAEVRKEGGATVDDGAVRLMAHQLASVMGIFTYDDSWWRDAAHECCRLAIESGHMTESLRSQWENHMTEAANE